MTTNLTPEEDCDHLDTCDDRTGLYAWDCANAEHHYQAWWGGDTYKVDVVYEHPLFVHGFREAGFGKRAHGPKQQRGK